jgi:hypothetical protein
VKALSADRLERTALWLNERKSALMGQRGEPTRGTVHVGSESEDVNYVAVLADGTHLDPDEVHNYSTHVLKTIAAFGVADDAYVDDAGNVIVVLNALNLMAIIQDGLIVGAHHERRVRDGEAD